MAFEIGIRDVKTSVLEYLREKIIVGEIEAGQKLNENQIATRLDISRHPLREAFRILENDRLVISNPRRGVFATEISIKDLDRIYWAREMIELSSIVSLEEQRIREFPKVAEALNRTSKLSTPKSNDQQERLTYLRTMADFHTNVVASAENKYLSGFYSSTYFHLLRYQYICSTMPGSSQRSFSEHQKILASLEAGKYDKASRLVKDHLAYTLSFLRKTLSSKGF